LLLYLLHHAKPGHGVVARFASSLSNVSVVVLAKAAVASEAASQSTAVSRDDVRRYAAVSLEVAGATLIIFVGIAVFAKGRLRR
jgi:hypothetical protein